MGIGKTLQGSLILLVTACTATDSTSTSTQGVTSTNGLAQNGLSTNGLYLSASGLSIGTYQLAINTPDGAVHTLQISSR